VICGEITTIGYEEFQVISMGAGGRGGFVFPTVVARSERREVGTVRSQTGEFGQLRESSSKSHSPSDVHCAFGKDTKGVWVLGWRKDVEDSFRAQRDGPVDIQDRMLRLK
jgi:hypothetical protein